ncbi:MAG: 2-C-methyl-D-erythritol 4-phosphate cytidylyltransferase [Opitutaceae bacterium]|jgi:2-C-methyl-D-erythritol 4-phosphate cytidylyltransferase
MSRVAAILLAAGRGSRMQDTVADKILAPLAGRPVFAHSVAAFQTSGIADFYAIVYRDTPQLRALMAYAPTPAIFVHGGQERQDSVSRALAALPGDIDYVFIHDCARPLVRAEQLVALHKIVRQEKAVVLAHRVADTIKDRLARASTDSRSAAKLRTLDRARLWAMETPQVFSRGLITRAYDHVAQGKLRITDDAQAVERLGRPIALLENPHPNLKLTTPADFAYLEFLLSK